MDSELVRALRADLRRCLDDVATEFRARGRDDTRFVQLIARMDALAAHDARESSLPGSTDIARGNDGPNVPDRDAIAWLVIDDERRPHYASSFPEACHDHINEALMHEDDDAKTWHVIPVCRMPTAQPHPSVAGLAHVPARISETEADLIGIPAAWYERVIAAAVRMQNPVPYTGQEKP